MQYALVQNARAGGVVESYFHAKDGVAGSNPAGVARLRSSVVEHVRFSRRLFPSNDFGWRSLRLLHL